MQYRDGCWGTGGSLPARGPFGGVVARDFFPRPQYSVLFCDVKVLKLKSKKLYRPTFYIVLSCKAIRESPNL